MLDYMFRERSEEEDKIMILEEKLKKEQEDNDRRISNLEHEYKNKLKKKEDEINSLKQDLYNTDNDTTHELDTRFMEKGLYAQLLFMVGRTTDAKKAAEKWIAEYEIDNKLRKPTKEEQAEIDRVKDEQFKKLQEIFTNMKKN